MADVRCPMCGKSNPAEREICLFCQARLKPLWEETPSGGSQDMPDWLRSIQESPEPGVTPARQSPAVPDWLSSLRDQTAEDETSSPKDQSEIPPAGLRKGQTKLLEGFMLQPEDLEEDRPTEQKEEFPEFDADWLSRIGAKEEGPASQPFASTDLPDWLSSASQEAAPDWLHGEAAAGEGSATGREAEVELPDWLRSEVAPHAPMAPAGEPESGLPEWLSGSEQKSELDWLRDEAAPKEMSAPGGEVEVELPGWLNSEAGPSTPAETGGKAPKGMSGWLRDKAAVDSPAVPAGEPETDLPDWLRNDVAAAPVGEPTTDLPDWLTGAEQEGGLAWLHDEAPPAAPAASPGKVDME